MTFFYSAAVFLFFALSFGSGITRIYGFTLFPDEFGYWAPAASAVGYDWSGVMAHGSYYSFGYSVLLAPILLLCDHAIWAYRAALFMNALLLAAAFVLLQGIVKKLVPGAPPAQRVLSAGIACSYPPWLLYRNMTMAEILLVFCLVLVCRLLLWYLERPSFGRFAAAGISAVYLYTVHMRSVPVLLSCVGCMVFVWLYDMRRSVRRLCVGECGDQRGGYVAETAAAREVREASDVAENVEMSAKLQAARGSDNTADCGKSATPRIAGCLRCTGPCRMSAIIQLTGALAVIGAAVLAAVWIKECTQASVYGKADNAMLSVNDYGGQISRIREIFTWKGFSELMFSLVGKFYYLSLSSFGLFFAGIWFFLKKSADKNAGVRERIFALFFLLVTAGEIVVCAVYTKGYGRIDALCYGRYDELILPVLMAVGCFAVMQMRHPVRYAAAVILGGLPVTAILEAVIRSRQLTDINGGYFISGLSYLLRFGSFEPENYFWKAYVLAAVFIALMMTALLIVRRRGDFTWLLLICIGVETLLGMSLNESMVYRQSRVRYQDLRMVEALRGLEGENVAPERRIVCYGGTDTGCYAAVVQFELRDRTIFFFLPEEADRLAEYDLVMACEKEDRGALAARYTEHRVYGIFHLYYNE